MSARVRSGTCRPARQAISSALRPTKSGCGSRCGVIRAAPSASAAAAAQEVSALRLELATNLLRDRRIDHHGVLRRAEQAVVEGLAGENVPHGLRDVRGSARCRPARCRDRPRRPACRPNRRRARGPCRPSRVSRPTRGWRIRACVARQAHRRPCRRSHRPGAPARRAAPSSNRTVRSMQSTAAGCGLSTMAQRAFIAISSL